LDKTPRRANLKVNRLKDKHNLRLALGPRHPMHEIEREETGGRTSASDFLNRGK